MVHCLYMDVPQKLQFIKKLSNLTQEKIAQKLGVSFVTFNSWINGRSIPRRMAQERINELYREYTGQKEIPIDVLLAKKQIIESKGKKYKNILKKILSSPDIYDQFILSLTYNTNSIEGSSLSEPETAAILFQNVALPNKDLIEQLEAKNHQTALEYLFRHIEERKNINKAMILKLHGILMNGIRQDAGAYRRHAVRIVGANIATANYLKVPILMDRLIKDIRRPVKDIINHVAVTHSRFEAIHPFSDGNGRIGRLLIHAMLLQRNLPPATIKQEKRQFYYSYLNKAQRKNDFNLLENFISDAILEGFEIIERKKK